MPEAAAPAEPVPTAETVPAMTARDAVLAGARALSRSETPRLDAELLLGAVLGVDRARLVLDSREVVDPAALARFWSLVERRAACEPVAYILGRREFRRITLAVDRRVLVPRPETELLVEAALELPAGARVVDVGTGSGAVALALADERPDLSVLGVDVSAAALEVAWGNARRLGLPVRFLEADLLEGVAGPWDGVVANLPYVSRSASLPPDVADFEPPVALFADDDGLALVRRLVGMLGDVPFVALEVGEGQAGEVSALVAGAGFEFVERRRDLAGIERVVIGRR